MSTELAARLFGNAIPLLIGIWAAYFIQNKKQKPKWPIWPIALGALITVSGVTQTLLRVVQAQREDSLVKVQRTEQPSGGLKEEDLDSRYMTEIGVFFVRELEAADPGADFDSNSSVVEKGGKRLGVIRISDAKSVPVVLVIGLSNDKLVRIMCGVGAGDVDIDSSHCAAALREEFGVTIDD